MSIVENEESNLILSHVYGVETMHSKPNSHKGGYTPNTHYTYTKKYYSNSVYVKINKIRIFLFLFFMSNIRKNIARRQYTDCIVLSLSFILNHGLIRITLLPWLIGPYLVTLSILHKTYTYNFKKSLGGR